MNSYVPLGRIGEQTLTEIWNGPTRSELATRTEAGDLSMGCDLCSVVVEDGDPAAAYLHVFDDLEVQAGYPSQLELALSNACNLQCVMCNGDLSSAIRIHREQRGVLTSPYDDAFFDELDDFLAHAQRIVFLGGEPLLSPESLRVAERLVELGLKPNCHFTTNGTQWSDRIQRIVSNLPAHVAISIDGATNETNSSIRVGTDHSAVKANILRFRDLTRSTGSDCSLAFSLMRPNVSELGQLLLWADSIDVDVFINDVSYPPQFSLHHMTGDELDTVLALLHEQDLTLDGELGRNRDRWKSTVRNLNALRFHRSSMVGTATEHDLPGTARALMTMAGPDVYHVGVASSQLIRLVDGPEESELTRKLRSIIGDHVNAMVEPLLVTLGRTQWTHLERREDGIEVRTTEFTNDGGRKRLDAAVATSDDGTQDWYFVVTEP